MTAVLSLEQVSKRYGKTPVLHDVTLDVKPGEFVVLIGGSGSGKTTLLRLVGGLEHADRGVIRMRGKVVDEPAKGRFISAERRGLGMVFQDYALWPHFTCLQNVEAAARGTQTARRGAAMELLDRVGMAQYAAVFPHQISGGQQQRIGVARALAARPDLLLFDEALSSVDVDIRERLRMEIRELAQKFGTAALFVSHDPLDAWRLADRIAVLEDGLLTQTATPSEFYANPKTPRAARFIGAIGGFGAEIVDEQGELGIGVGGRFCRVTSIGVKSGQRAIVYARPEGVSRAEDGIPANLLYCLFEAGWHRAYWQLADIGVSLCSLESAPPDVTTAKLKIDRRHIFAYPVIGDIAND
ncbi:MAG: ABC transporter ATP-binding protein [Alphaproteobacteria bacterium]|nr:ABC transporter ATP-binding protein [Alphaproteobacteria bacterium]MDE2112247.1 ABC transporter ATP-binding protein [Alphaproteobacteria bacterium]MDE2494179.1 ABC transporter ATP-binding protein [Alphaproteobacteria bacterium]